MSVPPDEVVPVGVGPAPGVQSEVPVKVLLVEDERQASTFVVHLIFFIRIDFHDTKGGGITVSSRQQTMV